MRIRSIWMADVAQEGQSSVINEDSLGNDRMAYACLIRALVMLTPLQLAGSTTREISST